MDKDKTTELKPHIQTKKSSKPQYKPFWQIKEAYLEAEKLNRGKNAKG